MQEAINLSGMFIDRGPLSILKFKNKKSLTIKDPTRGLLFKKPLLILVNKYSASASEFFTAAMKDYNRAIIVGSQTYGKGTAQSILPLNDSTNLGFVKLTVEQFFRINGTSHQAKGVMPDIKLPSIYQNFKDQEKFKDFAIKNDTVKVNLKPQRLSLKDLTSIITKSNIRVSANEGFKSINNQSQLFYNIVSNIAQPYQLKLDQIKKNMSFRKAQLNDIFKNSTDNLIEVKNTSSNQEILSYNEENLAQNRINLETISKNIYIQESYYILNDYINLN